MPLRYHKPAAYKLLTQTYKDKLRDHQIAMNGNTGGKGGGGKEKGSLRSNITSILKYFTAEEKYKKDGKAEIISELQSLIVATMSGNEFPFVPPRNRIKAAIESTEAMKSSNIDGAETISSGAAADEKLMECITDMSLKRASGKPVKYVRT